MFDCLCCGFSISYLVLKNQKGTELFVYKLSLIYYLQDVLLYVYLA